MVLERLRLDGKVAIVTGGGTGLGKAMALAMAGAGADVVVSARREAPIEAVAEQIAAKGRRGMAIKADVTDSAQVQVMVERVLAEFGKIDILINNAGGGGGAAPGRTLFDITDEDWRKGIDTNLTGAFYCSRAAAAHMVERKSGSIINVASGHGMRGAPNSFMYNSAKAGTITFTKSLALSLVGDNIRVHCIVPGFVAQNDPESDEDWQRLRERGRFVPVGRIGYASELGPLAVMLASDASSYTTGQSFVIDGGGLQGAIAPIQLAPNVPL
jgi:NAD(P)-dependent dehydrogenase (short-subunit alcohol dehydrogenase family)